jgi:hypothetical protein
LFYFTVVPLQALISLPRSSTTHSLEDLSKEDFWMVCDLAVNGLKTSGAQAAVIDHLWQWSRPGRRLHGQTSVEKLGIASYYLDRSSQDKLGWARRDLNSSCAKNLLLEAKLAPYNQNKGS